MIEIFIHEVLIGIIVLTSFWLALLVYKNNPQGKINKVFVVMSVLMFIWVVGACFARILLFLDLSFMGYSLILLKISWFSTPMLFLSIYLFSIFILKEEKKYLLLTRTAICIGCFASIIVLTNFVLMDIKFSNGILSLVYGKGIIPFLLLVVFLMIAAIYPLFKKYSFLSSKERSKIQIFIMGIFIFYAANIIFNIFLPIALGISQYYWLGDYSLIFLLGFLAYAILKHEFLEIKSALSQFLAAAMSILLLINFIGSTTYFEYFWKGAVFSLSLFIGYLFIKSLAKEAELKENLTESNQSLKELNQTLDQKVRHRTREVKKAYEEIKKRKDELEKFYKLTVGRELKMAELKNKIKNLEKVTE